MNITFRDAMIPNSNSGIFTYVPPSIIFDKLIFFREIRFLVFTVGVLQCLCAAIIFPFFDRIEMISYSEIVFGQGGQWCSHFLLGNFRLLSKQWAEFFEKSTVQILNSEIIEKPKSQFLSAFEYIIPFNKWRGMFMKNWEIFFTFQ